MLEKQLKKGTRVVAHDFEIPGWHPVDVQQSRTMGRPQSHSLPL